MLRLLSLEHKHQPLFGFRETRKASHDMDLGANHRALLPIILPTAYSKYALLRRSLDLLHGPVIVPRDPATQADPKE